MYHPATPEKLMKGWTTRKSSPFAHLALFLSVILVNEQGNVDQKNGKNQNKITVARGRISIGISVLLLPGAQLAPLQEGKPLRVRLLHFPTGQSCDRLQLPAPVSANQPNVLAGGLSNRARLRLRCRVPEGKVP